MGSPEPSRYCFMWTWRCGWGLQSPLNRHSHPSFWLPMTSLVSSAGCGLRYLLPGPQEEGFQKTKVLPYPDSLCDKRTNYFPSTVSQLLNRRKRFSTFSLLVLGEVTPAILWKPSSEGHAIWYQWERARKHGVWEVKLGDIACFCLLTFCWNTTYLQKNALCIRVQSSKMFKNWIVCVTNIQIEKRNLLSPRKTFPCASSIHCCPSPPCWRRTPQTSSVSVYVI